MIATPTPLPMPPLKIGCRAADRAEQLARDLDLEPVRCPCGSTRIAYGRSGPKHDSHGRLGPGRREAINREGVLDSACAYCTVCRDCGAIGEWFPRADTQHRREKQVRRQAMDLMRDNSPEKPKQAGVVTARMLAQMRDLDRHGLSAAEIAQQLGLHRQTVLATLAGAIRPLRAVRCPECGGLLTEQPCQACAEERAFESIARRRGQAVKNGASWSDPFASELPLDLTPHERHWYGASVIALGLPTRVTNMLEESGVLTVWTLLHTDREDLLRLPNFGPTTLALVLSSVARYLARMKAAAAEPTPTPNESGGETTPASDVAAPSAPR